MTWWEAGESRFKLVPTSNGNNHWLGSLNCIERLHSKCSDEAKKEKCNY